MNEHQPTRIIHSRLIRRPPAECESDNYNIENTERECADTTGTVRLPSAGHFLC